MSAVTQLQSLLLLAALLAPAGSAQAAATIQFSAGGYGRAGSYGVAETAETVFLPVQRLSDASTPVSVDYATLNGTATAGTHYIATNGTVSFAAGETNQLIGVTLLHEGRVEGTNVFQVLLSNPTGGAVLRTRTNATVSIIPNDARVQFELTHYTIQRSDGLATLRVLRGNHPPLAPFTVDYATSDGTATNGLAYTASNGTLAFAQGELVKTVNIPILYHEQQEPDRQFSLTLSNPTSDVSLGAKAKTTITIVDTTGMIPHRFEGAAVLADGSVRLTLGGGVSRRFNDYYDLYPIEVSSNLVDWVPLVTLQHGNALGNALTYTDTSTGNWPVRFYRTPTNHLITPLALKPTGPHPVGVLSRKLTDHSRPNRYHAYDDGSFMISVWYPAVALAGLLPGPLLEPQMAQDPYCSQQLNSAGYPGRNWADRIPQLVEYGLPNAPIATNLSPSPILLCSPQGLGWRASLSEKAANFASHGYVVVLSDPCDALATVFPDGSYLAQPQATWPYRGDCNHDRARDLAFILDELTRWNVDDPVFARRLDLAKVATMGSCSGYGAAAEFCYNDPRCQAAILVSCSPARWVAPLQSSSAPIPALDQFGLGKPQLVIFADYSDAGSYYDFLFNKATRDATVFQVKGAASGGYGGMILVQDFYLLLEPYRQGLGKDAARTITDYSLWFLNKHLKGSRDPSPPLANYPRILGFKQK